MARKSSTAPPAIRAPPAAKSPRPKGSSTTAALLAVVNGARVGVGSVYLTTQSALVTLILQSLRGGLPCSRTAVSHAIASARQPTTTQSDRILLQLTEHVSGEYLTLPVSRRGPRGVQAGIAGSHSQGLAACLTLPSEGDGAIAGHGDYPEPRQPGTRQERMGWYGRSGTGR